MSNVTPPLVERYRRARLAAPTQPARGNARLPSWLYAMGAVSTKQADKKAWIAFWVVFVAAPIWVGFGPIDGTHTIGHYPVPAGWPFKLDLPITLASVVVAVWVYFQYLCGPLLNWAAPPLLQGSRFFSERLAAAPEDLQFRYGAVPVALIVVPLAVLAVCTAHTDAHMTGVVAYFTILLAGVSFPDLVEALDGKRVPWANMLRKRPTVDLETTPVPTPGPWEIYIGRAVGKFAARGHVAGIDGDEGIKLGRDDVLRSIAIIGDTGSGKTAAGIRPLVVQLLDHQAGLVILDGKNDIGPEVADVAERMGRKVYRVGVGSLGVNLFATLTPDQVSDILEQAFALTGTGSDGFFTSQALMRCKNALGILFEMDRENYNLAGLRKFVFDEEFREKLIVAAKKAYAGDDEENENEPHREKSREEKRRERILEILIDYERNEWREIGKAPETVAGILANVQNLFFGFTDPDLIDAFSSDEVAQADFRELDKGAVFIVDLSLAKYGPAAQIVYLFVKEAAFRFIKSRSELTEQQKQNARVIGIICDEYQKITGGMSDLNAIDTMRSLGGFMACCFQSVNSLRAVIKNGAAVDALLANLTQKLVFASGDPDTINYVSSVMGQAERFTTTTSSNSGKEKTSGKSGENKLFSVADAQTFRALRHEGQVAQAVALLRIGGTAYDDVIWTKKVYANHLRTPREEKPSIVTGSEKPEAPENIGAKQTKGVRVASNNDA